MKSRLTFVSFACFGFSSVLVLGGVSVAAFELTIPGNQDASLFSENRMNGNCPGPTAGDFNGDGISDLIVSYCGFGEGFFIFLGGPWNTTDTFTNRADFQIAVPTQLTTKPPPLLADLDGDHKQELIFFLQSNTWPIAGPSDTLVVMRGRDSDPSRLIDLSSTPPDLLIYLSTTSSHAIAAGDIDGDGCEDIAIGSRNDNAPGRTAAGRCSIFFGRPTLPTGSVQLKDDPKLATLLGNNNDRLGESVFVEDLDQNGKSDLFVNNAIFYGKNPFPSTWDLAVTSANVRILGGSIGGLGFSPVGDMNGDGRSEILVDAPFSVIDGAVFAEDRPLLDIRTGASNFVPTIPISLGITAYDKSWGDFDGDSLSDLFFYGIPSTGGPVILGILSSERGTGPLVAVSTPSSIFQFPHQRFRHQMIKDINQDGRGDFVSTEFFDYSRPPGISLGAAYLIYGFTPLADPIVRILPRNSLALQVSLTLQVGGQPTEMMILGDISDAFKEQWIPYTTSLPVTLTPTPGTKTVRAKFRNAYLRESALVSDTWNLALNVGRITVVTNRLEKNSGRKARFECHIAEPSSVDATVLDINGEKVRDLVHGPQSTGVLTLEWDGVNDAGRRVVPGVYYLVIILNGQVTREKIVVSG